MGKMSPQLPLICQDQRFDPQPLTSRQLKVKPKTSNVSGLQFADILAHPSRAEMLEKEGLLGRELAPFSMKIISILQEKYDQHEGTVFGKKFL